MDTAVELSAVVTPMSTDSSTMLSTGGGHRQRKGFSTFAGPGALVAVGYMDPGNWATGIAGGSAYNYRLLFIIVLSSIFAVFLQALSLRLGIVSGMDLAKACKEKYSPKTSAILWITAEISIAACDLAEVIGSALGMKLLFGLPLIWGVLITALDVLLVIFLTQRNLRIVEGIVLALIAVISTSFAIEMVWSRPDPLRILEGAFVPSTSLVTDAGMLYIGIGILGATVMPHNLYLHSSVVQPAEGAEDLPDKTHALSMSTIDSTVALIAAFFVNASILILAASTFYDSGNKDVKDLEEAAEMLARVLGKRMAASLFGVALLASGQQSTITGTLAGQIVMEGFMEWKMNPALRRLVTRLCAITPAVVVVLAFGEGSVNDLLVLSQVVLSLQLSFAVFPLVRFTSDPGVMGDFVNSRRTKVLAYLVATFILVLNVILVIQSIMDWV